MKQLILVGGGHAHLSVLQELAAPRTADTEVTLVSPDRWQTYSGMLPGWLAGHYRLSDCRIDLARLAANAGVTFVQQAIVGMDADRRVVCLTDGRHLNYQLLSLDVGSETDQSALAALGSRLVSIKPLAQFQQGWSECLKHARTAAVFEVVVVGGGAAGVELALAAQRNLQMAEVRGVVTLATGQSGLLPQFPLGFRKRAARVLAQASIKIIGATVVGTERGLFLGGGEQLAADVVLAATGACAPAWLRASSLNLDPNGFVQVDQFHRSVSHANVFAAGDVCARVDSVMARSGVHAVHAGPVLAYNLLAALQGAALRPYRPKRRSLYLLSTGSRYAIASWGPFHTEGAWVWRWKDWIDRRFIRRFSATQTIGKVIEPMP